MQIDVDKDMDFTDDDADNLSAELDEYQDKLRRFIRTRGVKINNLGSDVADPRGTYDPIIDLISGATGIPRRILLGTESGHLASTQDKGNWAERIEEYRTLVGAPCILDPFIWMLVDAGILSDPGEYEIRWPDAYRMSPLERGQQAAQISRTAGNFARMVSDWQKMQIERQRAARGEFGGSTQTMIPDKSKESAAEPTVHALDPKAKLPFGKKPGDPKAGPPMPPAPAEKLPDAVKLTPITGELLTLEEMRIVLNEATDKRTIQVRGRRKR
jgi:hypothetical protein